MKITDPMAILASNHEKGLTKKECITKYCEVLLDDLSKVKGEDLAPHLKEIQWEKKTKSIEITLSFPLETKSPNQ